MRSPAQYLYSRCCPYKFLPFLRPNYVTERGEVSSILELSRCTLATRQEEWKVVVDFLSRLVYFSHSIRLRLDNARQYLTRCQYGPDNIQIFYHEDIVRPSAEPWNPKVRPRLCAAGKPPSIVHTLRSSSSEWSTTHPKNLTIEATKNYADKEMRSSELLPRVHASCPICRCMT